MFNLLKIVPILILILIIIPLPQVFAQVSFAPLANQISVNITIGSDSEVHVVHLIQKSSAVKQVNTITGTVQELKVTDVNSDDIQYAVIGNNQGVTIFPTKENIIVEYDLKDVLILNDEIWTWDFFYPFSSAFYFPDGVDLVFANNRPVPLKDVKGMNCHGCQMTLEYIINEPINVNEIKWEDRKFPVIIRTVDEISSFNFDQPSKKLSFEVSKGNRFITMIIPLELLWNPFEVFFNGEKILKHEFLQNNTHVWLNVKPESPGTIEVIGTSVIPEFPMMLPLVLGIAIVLGFQIKKINRH